MKIKKIIELFNITSIYWFTYQNKISKLSIKQSNTKNDAGHQAQPRKSQWKSAVTWLEIFINIFSLTDIMQKIYTI